MLALKHPTIYANLNRAEYNHAELMLLAYTRRVPQIPRRGAKPDTETGVGRLAFCRQVVPPSLLMELGFLTNPEDRQILQTRRREVALGVADGLAAWSRAVSGEGPTQPTVSNAPINIRINSNDHEDFTPIRSSCKPG